MTHKSNSVFQEEGSTWDLYSH